MKILIIEDEQKTGDYLKQGLSEAGFVADLARDGADGMHMALTEEFDLIVLDVMLPRVDGWQVLRAIRAAGKQLPLLFRTARDRVAHAPRCATAPTAICSSLPRSIVSASFTTAPQMRPVTALAAATTV